VDAYGDKTGGRTLREAEKRWGPLPHTVISSSRDDCVSGIRLYRIPQSIELPGDIKLMLDDGRACPESRGTWVTIHGEL
jgi:hypothetical protein